MKSSHAFDGRIWSLGQARCYCLIGVSRYRLRYEATNLELFTGEFTIGRSSACNLALVDGLVSRRHAVLHVSPSEVVAEDLGSRNGILVNGEPAVGPRRLDHMDRIYIGAQELVLIDSQRVSIAPKPGASVICDSCGAVNGSSRRRCGDCGARLISEAAATRTEPPKSLASPHTWGGPENTRTETTRDVVEGIAAKAVELGRFREAERILFPHLDRLMERALNRQPLSRSGQRDEATLVARATRNALELRK